MSHELQQNFNAPPQVIDTGVQQAILTEMRFLREAINEVKTTVSSYPALIERQASTEQRQAATEDRFVDALEKVETSIIRIHERMDEVRDIVSTDMQTVKEEFRQFREDHRKETVALVESGMGSIVSQTASLSTKVGDIKTETEGWINKGKGVWFVASIMWSAIQAIVLAVMMWFFSEVRTLHDWKVVADHRIEALEHSAGSGAVPAAGTPPPLTGTYRK
jgi:hypothetical protein